MSTNKGAVLVPENQLSDEELEEISGGLLPAFNPTAPSLGNFFFKPGLKAFKPELAGGCGTDDSGAMGCPG